MLAAGTKSYDLLLDLLADLLIEDLVAEQIPELGSWDRAATSACTDLSRAARNDAS